MKEELDILMLEDGFVALAGGILGSCYRPVMTEASVYVSQCRPFANHGLLITACVKELVQAPVLLCYCSEYTDGHEGETKGALAAESQERQTESEEPACEVR